MILKSAKTSSEVFSRKKVSGNSFQSRCIVAAFAVVVSIAAVVAVTAVVAAVFAVVAAAATVAVVVAVSFML